MPEIASITAIAHPNIAFIKYWGNRDDALRLPANSSLSMNLGSLQTKTTMEFDSSLSEDRLEFNNKLALPEQAARVTQFLDLVREMAGVESYANVISENNFPSGSGIASSSSAFAALALASSSAAGLELSEVALSRLARRGSGSASRSVPGGIVEWRAAADADSYAFTIAPPNHWELEDCIAVVSEEHKTTGSTTGHSLAPSSPLQDARLASAEKRLDLCRSAILQRDFAALAEVVEFDSHLMHAVMMTSSPPLLYWQPTSLAVMRAVSEWRAAGLAACYTLDAGPNVHVICLTEVADKVSAQLALIPGVLRVLRSGVGGSARLIDSSSN